VVFWQTDENDQLAYVKEPFKKALTPANIKKEQEFYESDLEFRISAKAGDSERVITFTLKPEDNFAKRFEAETKKAFIEEIRELTQGIESSDEKNKCIKSFASNLNFQATFTHRHYVEDSEYIPYGEDIEAFLKREIGKPIIRWKDGNQLGYEILPNKYFYRYQPPKPADEVLKEFWRLEKEAASMLKSVGGEL
jgi:type I restriction enzyme M protein